MENKKRRRDRKQPRGIFQEGIDEDFSKDEELQKAHLP
jgi:hypothetical protein